MLGALAPLQAMEMPAEAQLSGGWMRVAGGTPGNQASAALCCPLGAAAQNPEMARLRGFLVPAAPAPGGEGGGGEIML